MARKIRWKSVSPAWRKPHPNQRAVVAESPVPGGVGYYFPSQVLAELYISGWRTGGVSVAIRKGGLHYGLRWSRV